MTRSKILWGIAILLVLMQFIRIDQTNPVTDPAQDFLAVNATENTTAALIRSACYDCHSHETEYPWYAQVAPVSWWLQNHIREGRQHLNFSIWSSYPQDKQMHKMEECAEMTGEGEMPMASFTWTHPEARLTHEQKTMLVGYFTKLSGVGSEKGKTERVEEQKNE